VRIVLDSSVVVEHDWNLAHNDAQALLAACDRGAIELFVPEVVIDEVVNRYEKRESKKIKVAWTPPTLSPQAADFVVASVS
jgi:predicted nucleic acid-binding protein